MESTPHAQARPGSLSDTTGERLRLLIDTGLRLASERNLQRVVEIALDAGLRICCAEFGVFFYNNLGEDGELFECFQAIAADPAWLAPASHAAPHYAAAFPPSISSAARCGVQRFDDIAQSPAFQSSFFQSSKSNTASAFANGHSPPFPGMRPGHPPVRSLLLVAVCSPAGEMLGSVAYGHSSPGFFDSGCEELVVTVASQAAVAVDNARLASTLSHEICLSEASRQLQRETAGRLRQALDAAQLGTWSWDRATDLLDLDERAAELFQVPPHACITRTAMRERLVVPEDREMVTAGLERSLQSGDPYTAEYRVSSPSGALTWIAARSITTCQPGSSEVTGMVGTVQDITTRKNSEAALRQSEKLAATGRLAATIAHEINNPLEAVTNLIYLSKTDPGVPAPVKGLLETADHELARVAQIAQQTLGFYRDTGRTVEIDLNNLLQHAVELFKRRMQSRQIVCTLDLQPELTIVGLPGEIRQVVSNLLVNAIDATPGSGAVHIRARRRLQNTIEGVSILVADRGAGIPVSVRSRLFSPFFTTKEIVGTGLGLWVTRGIVEKQGGVISFRSRTEPPSGTVFRVFLPKVTKLSDDEQTRLPRG